MIIYDNDDNGNYIGDDDDDDETNAYPPLPPLLLSPSLTPSQSGTENAMECPVSLSLLAGLVSAAQKQVPFAY